MLLLLAARVSLAAAQGSTGVQIDQPKAGEALQGVVTIHGALDKAASRPEGNFRAAEVSFAYDHNPTHTWFLIQQATKVGDDGFQASWDTTTMTDGNYQLRLQVTLADGQALETIVSGLRVRNYQPVETSTPAAGRLATPALARQTATPLPDFQVEARTPAPLPTNPAILTPQELRSSALRGIGVVLGALAAGGVFLWLRAVLRR